MSTRKVQLLRRAAGNDKSRPVAITGEEKALRAFLESAGGVTEEYVDAAISEAIKNSDHVSTGEMEIYVNTAILGAMEASY